MLQTSLDDLDKRILKLLQFNCRLSFADLSRGEMSLKLQLDFGLADL